MAKWEQRAVEALKKGRLKEFKLMSGKLGKDVVKRLKKQYLKKEVKIVEPTPVKAEPVKKVAPKPRKKASSTTRKSSPAAKKTTTRRRRKTASTKE